ncbi:probable G-protein coupled receptor Mth-like 14 [Anopheles marshallii]|uniref:probable G-protein coupled receptor Mth-like 14 n=1 Tax=Anopheles marshallii TaxID=1521116 RepID=UPI00237A450C|nr:probable G-protein coupled receptor Mth-like 14 [Anopheles marshallii]
MGRLRNVSVSVWLVVIVCSVALTVASGLEGSGQGESTYEEYDDEGPYQGGYRGEDLDSLEDLAVHEDVLDPITDDDISYSGYDYEEQPDDAVTSSASATVTAPSTDSVLRQHVMLGNDSFSETEEKQSISVDDGQSTPLPGDNVTGNGLDPTSTTFAPTNENSCRDRQKLLIQPTFLSRNASVIKKCCPRGESFVREHAKYVSCQHDALSTILPQAIVAQFYQDCIEDLEEDIQLEVLIGNPCPYDGGMVSFSERTNDTLYIIQNGSLLVIYGGKDYDVYDSYCLDYDRDYRTLIGYVCPSEVRIMVDVVKGQLFLLILCLIIAIPALLVTAVLYMIIPKLHNLHGRALAMNCVNFAVALLLECFFQYRNRGKRMLIHDMVLKNYAEYFILATFFWLLVNCANNCIHAWYFVPAGKKFNSREENQRFAGYAAFAQLVPLWIIWKWSSTPAGTPAVKNYLFYPILATWALGFIFLLVTLVGLRRLKESHFNSLIICRRLLLEGRVDELCKFSPINGRKVNKVIYMSKYTIPLFVVMGIIWTVMAVTYYRSYELPIFYDILFGLQGILMFIIFVCMPRPWQTIREWCRDKRYCMWICPTGPGEEQAAVEEAPMMRQFEHVQMCRMPRACNVTSKQAECDVETHQSPQNVSKSKRIFRNKNPFIYLEED